MSEVAEMSSAGAEAVDSQICIRCGFMVSSSEASAGKEGAICTSCAEKVDGSSEGSVIAPRMPLAIVCGAAGALLGAGVWAGIAIFTNFEVGYVAILVGLAAGQGVKLGAGSGRSRSLQIAAAVLSVAGLIVAKYFVFAHHFSAALAQEGIDAGPFHPEIVSTFSRALPDMLSVFDLLWLALAVSTAWKIPARSVEP